MMYNKPSLSQVYDQLSQSLKTQIIKEQDSFILGSSVEQLVDCYYSTPFKVVEIDGSETVEIKKEVRTILAHQRDEMYRYQGDLEFEYELLIVTITIKPYPKIKQLVEYRSSTVSLSWSANEVSWSPTAISYTIVMKGYSIQKNEDQIKQDIQWQKERIIEWINWMNNDIATNNRNLKTDIESFIKNRKQKLEEDKDKYASLLKTINIPLRRKEDEVVKRIQVDQKPLVQKVRPNPKQPENYIIDREKVLDIIKILDNQGRQFEKTPKTYLHSGEEDLRNVLLVGLNTVFEGKVTGETFLAKGKTDIYLNIDKGNILVSECKIWGGQKLYSETIDQLLSYLTWRENYGILITFVRIKNLTKVLQEAQTTIENHATYKTGLRKIFDTHFISQHTILIDEMKHVELHHLFYNLHFV